VTTAGLPEAAALPTPPKGWWQARVGGCALAGLGLLRVAAAASGRPAVVTAA
jgi:hypothetical protein